MLAGERRVKWLDAEWSSVFGESLPRHQCDGSKATYIAIVQRASIVEYQLERGVAPLGLGQSACVNQQRAGESWLNNDALVRREIDYDELGSAPGSNNLCSEEPPGKGAWLDLAQNIRPGDADLENACSGELAVEVPGDRLGLR